MPETAPATAENEQQQGQNEESGGRRREAGGKDLQPKAYSLQPTADGKTVAQAAEFPEGRATSDERRDAGSGGQFDILLDMDVPITVVLGTTQIPVRRLLQLGPGALLKLDKAVGTPAELYLKDSRFAEADVVVVDDCFAVRIKKITGVGVEF